MMRFGLLLTRMTLALQVPHEVAEWARGHILAEAHTMTQLAGIKTATDAARGRDKPASAPAKPAADSLLAKGLRKQLADQVRLPGGK